MLFLDIKLGFDNIKATKLRSLLLSRNIHSYMVDWVSSFLSERKFTLVFQGAPNLTSPVLVGTPQGSPLSSAKIILCATGAQCVWRT